MGPRCSKGGLQTGICRETTFFGNKRNLCKRKRSKFDRFRNSGTFTKKCCRNSSQESNKNRFLQHIVFSTQKEWGNAPCYQFEATQQVSEEDTFQNGHYEKSSEPSSKGRLESKFRSKRRIFSHWDSQKTSQISPFLLQISSLPVQSSVLRSYSSTTSVYKNDSSSGCIPSKAKYKDCSISRRLVRSKSDKESAIAESSSSVESPFRTRLHSKQEEIFPRSKSDSDIHRGSILVGQRPSFSDTRENSGSETGCEFSSGGSDYSQRLLSSVGQNSFMHRSSTKCKVVHEANSTSFAAKLESSKNEYETSDSYYSVVTTPFDLVVTGSKHCQGMLFSTKAFLGNTDHRCEQHMGLGWPHEQPFRARPLVGVREITTHKLSGDGGSDQVCQTFSPQVKEQKCSNKIGQYYSGPVFEQARGDKVIDSLRESLGSVDDSIREWNQSESSSCNWQAKSFCRSIEQTDSEEYRVVSEQNSGKGNFLSSRVTDDGPFCHSREQSDATVLFMGSSSSGVCGGCPVFCMAEHVCLCVSTDTACSSGFESHETVQLYSNSDSPKLAETALVSTSIADVSCQTSETTFGARSPVSSKGQNSAPKPGDTKSDCMANINKRLEAEGFSEKSRTLLTASWRKGTQKDYKSKFRLFCHWCSEQQIDPYAASLKDCVNFLTYKFHQGAAYRTIAGYRSMMSAVLPPVDKFLVGQHPYVIRLLRGVFNERPPKKRLVPEWDLLLVLGTLKKTPFEPLKRASLRHLTWKTCFLVAVTSFRRCSDLQSLRLGEGFVNVQKKGVTFIREGLSKQDRPNHTPSHVFIPAFSENKKLDPKRCLAMYLKKTESYRRKGDSDVTQLFLSINKPHKPVSRQTISKWIVNTIQFAYSQNKKSVENVKGHSTRSLGPSWALFKGASLKDVLESADWARESTFVKHYMRTVNVDFLQP